MTLLTSIKIQGRQQTNYCDEPLHRAPPSAWCSPGTHRWPDWLWAGASPGPSEAFRCRIRWPCWSLKRAPSRWLMLNAENVRVFSSRAHTPTKSVKLASFRKNPSLDFGVTPSTDLLRERARLLLLSPTAKIMQEEEINRMTNNNDRSYLFPRLLSFAYF